LKYIYPAIPGTLVRGMPTAHGISPLKEQIVSSQGTQPLAATRRLHWRRDDFLVSGRFECQRYASD
jgi:hypothetical protein